MSGQVSSSLHLVVLLVCRRNRSQLENEKIRVLLPSLTPARSALAYLNIAYGGD